MATKKSIERKMSPKARKTEPLLVPTPVKTPFSPPAGRPPQAPRPQDPTRLRQGDLRKKYGIK